MARSQGTKFKLYELVSGGTKRAIAHLTANGISFEGETIDISTKSSNNWREFLPGYRSFTMNCEGRVDFQASGGEVDASTLMTYYINGTTLTVVSEDGVTGSKSFQGNVIISSFEISAPHDGSVDFTMTLQGTGSVTMTTI